MRLKGAVSVSILTRAFARVQPWAGCYRSGAARGFQSSLELSPECNANGQDNAGSRSRFQSSLELSPECNGAVVAACTGEPGVSILTRAFARVQRSQRYSYSLAHWLFQSSLELSPECNERALWVVAAGLGGFNPHSSFRPSATALF